MMKSALLTLFFVVAGMGLMPKAVAQENANAFDPTAPKPEQTYPKGAITFYFLLPSAKIYGTQNINSALVANSFPELPGSNISLSTGLGVGYSMGRFTIAADVARNNNLRQANEQRVDLNELTAGLYATYKVYRKEGMSLYPMVGIFFTQADLFLSAPTAPTTFGNLLTAPTSGALLTHEQETIMLGAGVDFASLTEGALATFQLQAGMHIAPAGGYAWESDFTTLTNAPIDTRSAFFLRLILGVGATW